MINPKKKSQIEKRTKQTIQGTYIHVLEEELEKIVFWWVMMMDKGTNLSMDDEPTIRGTTMSLHLRELEDLCLCGHFNTNPNPILQQSPSSLQSLCVEVSTTTTKKKHKIPKSKKDNPHPTRQIHKHPTRDLKLTNTKSKSTKHPTRREIQQTTQHPTKRESTTSQQEIWS